MVKTKKSAKTALGALTDEMAKPRIAASALDSIQSLSEKSHPHVEYVAEKKNLLNMFARSTRQAAR